MVSTLSASGIKLLRKVCGGTDVSVPVRRMKSPEDGRKELSNHSSPHAEAGLCGRRPWTLLSRALDALASP